MKNLERGAGVFQLGLPNAQSQRISAERDFIIKGFQAYVLTEGWVSEWVSQWRHKLPTESQ